MFVASCVFLELWIIQTLLSPVWCVVSLVVLDIVVGEFFLLPERDGFVVIFLLLIKRHEFALNLNIVVVSAEVIGVAMMISLVFVYHFIAWGVPFGSGNILWRPLE